MKLTTMQKFAVTLNAISLVTGMAFLTAAATGHFVKSDLSDEPAVLAFTLMAVTLLITWGYFFVLRERKKNCLPISRGARLAALPVALACGIGLFILPALLAPAYASVIWWAVIVLCSSLSILYILIHKARQT